MVAQFKSQNMSKGCDERQSGEHYTYSAVCVRDSEVVTFSHGTFLSLLQRVCNLPLFYCRDVETSIILQVDAIFYHVRIQQWW